MKKSNGGYIENVYSATGERLRSVQAVRMVDPGTSPGFTARTTLQYRGPVVYRDGKVDMVLFPGGYATVDGSAVTFHYYTQDYLGNNRAVVNGTTGAVEQTVAYYPYGAVIADLGTASTSGQPYKFGGKELTAANGLNEYDFGARSYYPAVPGFTKPDPLCEKRPDISPYLYCANNPVNSVDPTGKDSWTLDEMGNIMTYIATDKYDEIIAINRKNEEINIWKGDYGSVKQSPDEKSNDNPFTTLVASNDEIGLNVFEFLAENSSVEWSILQLGLTEDTVENILTTSHDEKAEAGGTAYIADHIFEIDVRNAFHSHPSGIEYPSGLDWDPDNPGDIQFAGWVDKYNRNIRAVYKIYNPLRKMYIEFNSESTNADFPNKN